MTRTAGDKQSLNQNESNEIVCFVVQDYGRLFKIKNSIMKFQKYMKRFKMSMLTEASRGWPKRAKSL